MKKLIKYTKKGMPFCIVSAGLFVLYSFTASQTEDIKKAEWLIGTWENKTQRGSVFETWKKESNNKLSGKSYMVNEKDTIVFENIQLLKELGHLYYVPVVKNQNNSLPIRFLAKTISDRKLVFENLEHDFPQYIMYTKITTDSLVAEISGTKNGQVRRQTFPMKKLAAH